MNGPRLVQLNELPPVACPCGSARRAFTNTAGSAASLHLVEICRDSRAHYHQQTTEIYLVLEGEGEIELDGKRFPVKPMTAIYIPPGCRHRALGPLKIINLVVPPFEPTDEWTD